MLNNFILNFNLLSMKKKTISLRGISEILSEKELKSVMGGSNNLGGCCIISCKDGYVSPPLCWSSCPNGYLLCYGGFKEIEYVECPKEYYWPSDQPHPIC